MFQTDDSSSTSFSFESWSRYIHDTTFSPIKRRHLFIYNKFCYVNEESNVNTVWAPDHNSRPQQC
jgi:hypothetical protein